MERFPQQNQGKESGPAITAVREYLESDFQEAKKDGSDQGWIDEAGEALTSLKKGDYDLALKYLEDYMEYLGAITDGADGNDEIMGDECNSVKALRDGLLNHLAGIN